ncbi:hypothetical protein T439DRAFT_53697 [Meredithblackwellia eburnea MCA 4105]
MEAPQAFCELSKYPTQDPYLLDTLSDRRGSYPHIGRAICERGVTEERKEARTEAGKSEEEGEIVRRLPVKRGRSSTYFSPRCSICGNRLDQVEGRNTKFREAHGEHQARFGDLGITPEQFMALTSPTDQAHVVGFQRAVEVTLSDPAGCSVPLIQYNLTSGVIESVSSVSGGVSFVNSVMEAAGIFATAAWATTSTHGE